MNNLKKFLIGFLILPILICFCAGVVFVGVKTSPFIVLGAIVIAFSVFLGFVNLDD
jgi:hypothetical protein